MVCDLTLILFFLELPFIFKVWIINSFYCYSISFEFLPDFIKQTYLDLPPNNMFRKKIVIIELLLR